MMKRLFLISGLVTLLAGMAPATATAAESKGLNLITSPLPINLSTAPGTTVTTDIRVKQTGSPKEQLKISMMRFGAYGEAGKPQLADPQPGDDYFKWVTFDKPIFTATDNVWQTIKMRIDVPKSAAFGYYYAVVFSRVGDDKTPGGNTNAINGGSAVLVLLDAKVPGAKRELKLESFGVEHGMYEFLPATFNAKFSNTGNVHVVPKGNIFITKDDKPVATLVFNGEQGNILPQSKRIYPMAWKDGFPHWEEKVVDGKSVADKNGKPAHTLAWTNGSGETKGLDYHLRMGKYTAHLFAVYDDGKRDVPLEATVTFWVVPWRLIGVAALAVGILIDYILIRLGIRKPKPNIFIRLRRRMRRKDA